MELKAVNQEITSELVRSILKDCSKSLGIDSDSSEFEELAKVIETQLDIKQSLGHSIANQGFTKWWEERKNDGLDLHYWNRLNQYLFHKGDIPPKVINVLDQTTDEILDYAGDPITEGSWRRRGMVIGHVQSGKTSNYSAVICKAADAGYKVIILLAGITNSLRKQTQERINEAFIGKHASELHNVQQQVIGAALHSSGKAKHPDFGTTNARDFILSSAVAQAGHQMQNKTQPIIFVCKKNVSTLRNLDKYFKNEFSDHTGDLPLLLIDDEADNASINTNATQETITAINRNIRSLLSRFSKSSYIGYTATPFANIFIDPNSSDEMQNDDLFPSDFIKSLDAPTNYVGPDRVFGADADLAEKMLIKISDHEDLLPTNHKSHHIVPILPDSLKKAIQVFILTKAIRVCRGDGSKHCTMMINVSRFNAVQQQLDGMVYEYVTKLKNDIFLNSTKSTGNSSKFVLELKATFDAEIGNHLDDKLTWPDVYKNLYRAVSATVVKQVNMTGKPLDYEEYSHDGLTVIAIGGLALSRGLTLEGLTVSYVLRNAAASDTLMQMGRWFGYRNNYEDLCKLFTTVSSINYYQEVTKSISELREEIKLMESYGATPNEFGLKVRESPESIRITAANKMRSAEKITLSIGYAGKTIEGHTLRPEIDNAGNFAHVNSFLTELGEPHSPKDIHCPNVVFWSDISKKSILKFLKGFKVSPMSKELFVRPKDNSSLASEYIQWASSDFSLWDVCINNPASQNDGKKSINFNEKKLELRIRHAGEKLDNRTYKITKNRRVGSGGDSAIGLLKTVKSQLDASSSAASDSLYNQYRNNKKPLLNIYLMNCMYDDPETGEKVFEDNVVTYSISFPSEVTQRQIKREYQANVVYQELELDLGKGSSSHIEEEVESLINE